MVSNGDVTDFVNVVFGVEDSSVLNEEVVLLLGEERHGEKEKGKESFHGERKKPLKRFNSGDGKYCRTEEKCHEEMRIKKLAEFPRKQVGEERKESRRRR